MKGETTIPMNGSGRTTTSSSSSGNAREIFLEDPLDAEGLASRLEEQTERASVRVSARLFGPPRCSLSWRGRCSLMKTLGSSGRLSRLTLHGTTMGQVLSAEMLATAIPQHLEVLRMDAGLVFDDASSVCALAQALRNHGHLREVRLENVLNHVRPFLRSSSSSGGRDAECSLLDPLFEALSTIPTLESFRFSCLASIVEWKTTLVSTRALRALLSSPRLKAIGLTNLGLGDEEFEAVAASRGDSLREVVLNGHENTLRGLRSLVYSCLSLGSEVSRLEAINHAKLSEELYLYVLICLERYGCPLRHFGATYPLRLDPAPIDLRLRLHSMDLGRRYYSPTATPRSCAGCLAEAADDPSCLYALLTERPDLWDRSRPNYHPPLPPQERPEEEGSKYPWRRRLVVGHQPHPMRRGALCWGLLAILFLLVRGIGLWGGDGGFRYHLHQQQHQQQQGDGGGLLPPVLEDPFGALSLESCSGPVGTQTSCPLRITAANHSLDPTVHQSPPIVVRAPPGDPLWSSQGHRFVVC